MRVIYKVWAYFPNVKRSRRELRICARGFKRFLKEMEERDYNGLWFVPDDLEGIKITERYFKYRAFYILKHKGELDV